MGGLELSGIESTEISTGGDDVIATGDGDKHIFGGFGMDTITAGAGDHVVMGDNGVVEYDTDGAPKVLETTDTADHPEYGGDDVIDITGDGDNIVFGGMGSDHITTRNGTDVIFGDNGRTTYAGPVGGLHLDRLESLLPTSGGPDTIATGNGTKYIIAGFGDDTAQTGTGDDILIGDNGVVLYDTNGLPALVYGTNPDVGGDDLLRTVDGTNIFIGGDGADTMHGGTGRDAMFGDGGKATLEEGAWRVLETIDPFIGGNDFIDGGPGRDVMMGGAGNNTFVGNLADDVMIDRYGRATFIPETQMAVSVIRLDTISLIANVQEKLEGGINIGEVPEVNVPLYGEARHGTGGLHRTGVGEGGKTAGFTAAVTAASLHHHGDYEAIPLKAETEEPLPEAAEEGKATGTDGRDVPPAQDAPAPVSSMPAPATMAATDAAGNAEEPLAGSGAVIAGIMGWKVLTGGAVAGRGAIDRQSFKDLAARQNKKRFKRWTSVG